MASTYTTSLTLTKIGNGEQSGTWGTTTNNNWDLVVDAIAGVVAVPISGTSGATLSVANGTADQARNAVLVVTGAISGVSAIIAPLVEKVYIISNQTTGGFAITIGGSTGTAVTIANGLTTLVYSDGTNFYSGITGFTGGNLSITGTINATGTITAPVINASLFGGAANKIPYQTGSSATNFIDAPPSAGSATILTYTPGSGFSWSTGTVSALAGGTTNSLVYQSSPGVTSFFAKPGTSDIFYLTYNGATNQFVWSTGGSVTSVSGGTNISITGTGASPVVNINGQVAIANGGTGAATASAALANLGAVSLTTTNSMSGAITATGGSLGDQRLGVTYSSYSSGLSAQALQLGVSGTGVIYSPAGGWDGSNAVGFLIPGAGNLQITSSNTLYTGAANCYKTGTGTAWIIASDSRIKKNVTSYTKGLVELNRINIKNFEFNGLGNTVDNVKGVGVIADEIAQVLPNTVGTSKVKLNPNDTERVDLKHFDSTELVYLLVNAVKELSAEVTALKAKVGA
jgi:hypothetical protein